MVIKENNLLEKGESVNVWLGSLWKEILGGKVRWIGIMDEICVKLGSYSYFVGWFGV